MSDQLRIVGLEWSSSLRLYEVGKIAIQADEARRDVELFDGHRDFRFDWVHLNITMSAGYLYQQLNAGASYTLPNSTVIASAAATGAMDLLNALRNRSLTVFFYPVILLGSTVDTTTKYKVFSDQRATPLIESEKAGFFKFPVPIRFKTTEPLTTYPTWANR